MLVYKSIDAYIWTPIPLSFKLLANFPILLYYSFHICWEGINWYNIANFYPFSQNQWMQYKSIHTHNNQMFVFDKYLKRYFLLWVFKFYFGIYSTPKLSRYDVLLPFIYKTIQWVPIDFYLSRLITFALIFVLGK